MAMVCRVKNTIRQYLMKTKCVHCLEEFEAVTEDHLFPKAWYPNTTPDNLEKWKFPSCVDCNNYYSRIEDDLMCQIGLCLDPDDSAGKGIAEKALRSIDPKSAKNEKDQRARAARKTKLYQTMMVYKDVPKTGVLPNFGSSTQLKNGYLTVKVSSTDLKDYGEKIARGLKYVLQDKQYISPEYKIETFFCKDEDVKDVLDKFGKSGTTIRRGPGFKVTRVIPVDNPDVSISIVEIWGRLKLFVTVDAVT